MPTTPRVSICCLCLLLAAGCSQSGQTAPGADKQHEAASTELDVPAALQQPTKSGFLGDYSKLKPNTLANFEGSLVEQSDALTQFRAFIIDQPKVLATTTARGKAIDAETASRLSDNLRAAMTDSIGVNFKVTDTPGPGVARVRTAVTQVAECFHEPGSPLRTIGGACVEMEIVDSATGARLAAATESSAVTSLDPLLKSTDPYYDAKLVFQHWSSRLAKRLTDAQP